MNTVDAAGMCQLASNLATAQARFETARRRPVHPPQLVGEWMNALLRDISNAKVICQRVGLTDGVRQFDAIWSHLTVKGIDMSVVATEAQHARETLESEAYKIRYLYVPPNMVGFVDHSELFGLDVYVNVESARQDVQDAGNCIALELSTAAVFHLMRVAEHGLRRLARKLRIALTHKGKPQNVEFADWEKIITWIKKELDTAHKLSPGVKKQATLQFYADVADHCVFMKDIWRNNVSHARKPYKQTEAIAVFERVRDFMKCVAAI